MTEPHLLGRKHLLFSPGNKTKKPLLFCVNDVPRRWATSSYKEFASIEGKSASYFGVASPFHLKTVEIKLSRDQNKQTDFRGHLPVAPSRASVLGSEVNLFGVDLFSVLSNRVIDTEAELGRRESSMERNLRSI